jgi:2-polyprenyl-3-methyl-5-hydroxy-6-metoxy-1,4-benzoquinol methylase
MESSLPQHLKSKPTDHDFSSCKLCGAPDGIPTFSLATNTIYVCSGCDFHYLDRLDPKGDDTPVTLTDRQRRYIDDRLASNAQILTARMQLVREFVDLTGQRCLDVGSGVGQFLQMLSAAGAVGVGIEPSGLRRAFARQRFDLELHPKPIEEPFWQEQNSSFDLVTLWDVL